MAAILILGGYVLIRARAAVSSCASPGQSITLCIDETVPAGTVRELVIRDGEYTGSTNAGVTAPHDGWLILKAETQGGVKVTGKLTLNPNTSKVVFVGFKFHGLHTHKGTKDIVYWYVDAKNPPNIWQPAGDCGGPSGTGCNNPNNPYGSKPNFILAYPDAATAGGPNVRPDGIRVLGSDVHDIGDDGFQIRGTDSFELGGSKVWNISEKALDSSGTLVNWDDIDGEDNWHNDLIQSTGGLTNLDFHDNDLAGRLQFGPEGASGYTNLEISNAWSHDSPNLGVFFGADETDTAYTGSRSNIFSWRHNGNKDRQDNIGATPIPIGSRLDRINIPDTNVRAYNVLPSGITAASSPEFIRAHASNPANLQLMLANWG